MTSTNLTIQAATAAEMEALRQQDYGVDIPTTMHFFDPASVPAGERPSKSFIPPEDGSRAQNFELEAKEVIVQDLRKLKAERPGYVGMDSVGFDLWSCPEAVHCIPNLEDWDKEEIIKEKYHPILIDMMCKQFQVEPSAISIGPCIFRAGFHDEGEYKTKAGQAEQKYVGVKQVEKDPKTGLPKPPRQHRDVFLNQVHVDGYPALFSEVEKKAEGQRFRCFTIWKPLNDVFNSSLALSDWNSVKPEDYNVVAVKLPTGGETEMPVVQYSKDITWYSPSHARPSDLLIHKQYDSREDVARRCVHSAFYDQRYRGDRRFAPRHSVELRVQLVGGI